MQTRQATRSPLMQQVIETYQSQGYRELKDFPDEYVLMIREEDGAKVRIGYHNGYGGTGLLEYR